MPENLHHKAQTWKHNEVDQKQNHCMFINYIICLYNLIFIICNFIDNLQKVDESSIAGKLNFTIPSSIDSLVGFCLTI